MAKKRKKNYHAHYSGIVGIVFLVLIILTLFFVQFKSTGKAYTNNLNQEFNCSVIEKCSNYDIEDLKKQSESLERRILNLENEIENLRLID